MSTSTKHRLVEYIEACTRGGSGWNPAYEETLGPYAKESEAWLTGHYKGLLTDVLQALGPRGIAHVLAAIQHIDSPPDPPTGPS